VNQLLTETLEDIVNTKVKLNSQLNGVMEYAARLEEDVFACENYSARRIQWEMDDAKRLLLASRRIALASGKGRNQDCRSGGSNESNNLLVFQGIIRKNHLLVTVVVLGK
jgi:hypothetical protein